MAGCSKEQCWLRILTNYASRGFACSLHGFLVIFPITVDELFSDKFVTTSVYQFFVGNPILIGYWNVVFANKSRKLGWISMKLGRWGWRLKRLSLARFQWNHTMGFWESAKKWVAEALFFCDVNDAPLLPLSLDRFLPNFPWTRPGGVSQHMVSYSRKVCINGSNFRKNPLFIVRYLWSAYGSRETFCDAYALSIP